MARSALAGVFTEFTLSYQVETSTWTTDANGNPIPAMDTETLIINFEPVKAPQIQLMEGADPKVVRGRGNCVDPVSMPLEVGPGTELAMTWAGRSGKLRILQVSADPLAVLDEVLGQEFIAEWRAT